MEFNMKHIFKIIPIFLIPFFFVGCVTTSKLEYAISAYKKENFEVAFKEFKILAEQGDVTSQTYLGFMYQSSHMGVEMDIQESFKWFTFAAEQGDEIAQNMLGSMYQSGVGVSLDLTYSYMWFSASVMSGYDQAKENQKKVESKMSSSQFTSAKKLARDCIQKKFKGCAVGTFK
jgi:uncharacterized protein